MMQALIKKYNFLIVPKTLGYLGFFVMSSFICYAIVYGDFFNEGTILMNLPWGIVSLVDIYIGLILFSSWVIWREQSLKSSFLWVMLILTFGNVVSCLYLLKAAYDVEGNVVAFWLGKERASEKYAS